MKHAQKAALGASMLVIAGTLSGCSDDHTTKPDPVVTVIADSLVFSRDGVPVSSA